jgi:hypothetical protein
MYRQQRSPSSRNSCKREAIPMFPSESKRKRSSICGLLPVSTVTTEQAEGLRTHHGHFERERPYQYRAAERPTRAVTTPANSRRSSPGFVTLKSTRTRHGPVAAVTRGHAHFPQSSPQDVAAASISSIESAKRSVCFAPSISRQTTSTRFWNIASAFSRMRYKG